ncbi:MAG: hypothetical protein KQ78_00021 [Candidatus Izimaplasma bacterium HR2]|nr:MAG: hypothetical protein KQ78_00021 [Candidatus Izimaplasma bacterium HR2]
MNEDFKKIYFNTMWRLWLVFSVLINVIMMGYAKQFPEGIIASIRRP